MQWIILDLLGSLIMAALVFLLAKAYKKAAPWLENIAIRMIVADGVKFAQKAFGHMDGSRRLHEASLAISTLLDRWKISLTPEEVRTFIESILLELQAQYGDKWQQLSPGNAKDIDDQEQ